MTHDKRWNVQQDGRGWPVGTSQATRDWLCAAVTKLLREHESLDLIQLLALLRKQEDCPEDFRQALIYDWLYATVERALRKVNAIEEYKLPPASRR